MNISQNAWLIYEWLLWKKSSVWLSIINIMLWDLSWRNIRQLGKSENLRNQKITTSTLLTTQFNKYKNSFVMIRLCILSNHRITLWCRRQISIRLSRSLWICRYTIQIAKYSNTTMEQTQILLFIISLLTKMLLNQPNT